MNANQLLAEIPKESWLHRWILVFPHSTVPISFLLYTGLSFLGACLGRKVYVDADVHKVWPMLNLLLIAPSGVGKSTAVKMARENLLSKVLEGPQIIPGAATMEKLHADLRVNSHALLIASELAAFFGKQKYLESLVPYTVELLDYNDDIERRFQTKGVITVPFPSVTVVGASTLEWLQEQLPSSAVGGGFLARFLIVEEQFKRQRRSRPGSGMTKQAKERLEKRREKVFEEFAELLEVPEGEIDFEDGWSGKDAYDIWSTNHKPLSGLLSPFAARAEASVLRLALLVALTCKRRGLTRADVKAGIALYKYSEDRLLHVVVPYTETGKNMERILNALLVGPLSEKAIKRQLRTNIAAGEVDRLIHTLLQTGEIRLREKDSKWERV